MRIARRAVASLTPDGDLIPGARPDALVLWPFTQNGVYPWRSASPRRVDPVNLLILRATPVDVFEVLAAAGWGRPDDGATHRTWVDGRFVSMSDHTALGTRAERVHLRLFDLDGATLAAAHHEVGDRRGRHTVTSWDRARAAATEALERAGFSLLAPSAVVCPRDVRGVPGDGRVWRLVSDAAFSEAGPSGAGRSVSGLA